MVWVRASCGFKESKIGAGCTGPLSRQRNEVNTPVRSRFDVPAALSGAGPELATMAAVPAWFLARREGLPRLMFSAQLIVRGVRFCDTGIAIPYGRSSPSLEAT